jgi:hypothetical protein
VLPEGYTKTVEKEVVSEHKIPLALYPNLSESQVIAMEVLD